jgi:hypothetical protein
VEKTRTFTETAMSRARAEERAREKLGFYRHLLTYALVIGALGIVNVIVSPGVLWFVWPASGWGLGLVAHAVSVYAFSDRTLRRMTERELRRHRS